MNAWSQRTKMHLLSIKDVIASKDKELVEDLDTIKEDDKKIINVK